MRNLDYSLRLKAIEIIPHSRSRFALVAESSFKTSSSSSLIWLYLESPTSNLSKSDHPVNPVMMKNAIGNYYPNSSAFSMDVCYCPLERCS